jgi:hypothetical protein
MSMADSRRLTPPVKAITSHQQVAAGGIESLNWCVHTHIAAAYPGILHGTLQQQHQQQPQQWGGML